MNEADPLVDEVRPPAEANASQGGAGCSVGSGASSFGAEILLVAGAVVLARRRRRAA